MARKTSLVSKAASQLRERLASTEFPVGSRLPTEASLAADLGVSRPTLRAALRELESHGLVSTRHGVGTFVTRATSVQAGLERIHSITESIRDSGKVPGVEYASRYRRHVLPEEATRMGVRGDTEALELRRTILADHEVVAYSYDLIPTEVLPEDFRDDEMDGSLLAFFTNRLGARNLHSEAEVHAVHSTHIGWGDDATQNELFILLDQLHYDDDDRLLLYSRAYFIEGRYKFTMRRTRD